MTMRCIVLDAMGVIFRAADDVAELLVPFAATAGGAASAKAVESAYLEASLGAIDADEFWQKIGLEPAVEDAYLTGHSLVPGVRDFLERARDAGVPVWCLSNDVDRWSRKLRAAFGIESFFTGAVISSAVRSRKPDRAIYECLIDRSGFRPEELLFVDDRPKNVQAAIALGIPSFLFGGYDSLGKQVFGG